MGSSTRSRDCTEPVSLSIVIANWNGGELLRRCIDSIAESAPRVPYEIVVVDNASTDGSARWLKAAAAASELEGARLRLIENATNVGFSRANNQAIAQSNAGMVLLLNADTEVTHGAIDRLIGTLQSDDSTGACGPRLVTPDGSLQHSAWRNPPSAWETVVSGIGLWRLIPRRLRGELLLGGHWDHATRRTVPMLFGTALLVKRQVIDAVGALDERFHMYAEDNEWCLRMTRAGWHVVFEPDATVVHCAAHFSLQRWGRDERLRVRLRSHLDFQRYCLPRTHMIANVVAGCAVMGLQRIWRALRRRRADDVAIVFEMYSADLRRAVRETARAFRSSPR